MAAMPNSRMILCMGGPLDGQRVPYTGREIRMPRRPNFPSSVSLISAAGPAPEIAFTYTNDIYRLRDFVHSEFGLHAERYVHNSLTDAQAFARKCDEWGVPQ